MEPWSPVGLGPQVLVLHGKKMEVPGTFEAKEGYGPL